MVGSQTGSFIPDRSFGHNLCFRCWIEQCEPILDIYVLRAFQWYKEHHKPLSFDPWNYFLTFLESTGTPFLKVKVALEVWGFTPSHFPTLPRVCDVTPGLPLGSQPYNPSYLGCEPRVKVATSQHFKGKRGVLVTHSSPISKLQHTRPLPPKCYELWSMPHFFILSLFSPLDL
jgi:hypothetical protein